MCYCALAGINNCRCYLNALGAQQQQFVSHDTVARRYVNLEDRNMTRPNARDYTTDELERLTTLTLRTLKPGEFAACITKPPLAVMRLIDDTCVLANGQRANIGSVYYDHQANETRLLEAIDLRRRVTSFTAPTELDPPQAEMMAELERRRKPQPVEGQEYRYRNDDPNWASFRFYAGTWQRRASGETEWRACNTSRPCSICAEAFEKGEMVPYTPPTKPTISNATHAGRRVCFGDRQFIVVSAFDANQIAPYYKIEGRVVAIDLTRGTSFAPIASELELL